MRSSIVITVLLGLSVSLQSSAQPVSVGQFSIQVGRSFSEVDGLPLGSVALSIGLREDGVFLAQFPEGVYAFESGSWKRQVAASPSDAHAGRLSRPIPPEALASIPVTPVTAFAHDPAGGIWAGTPQGAAYYAAGEWRYRQGRRWLPNDHVLDLRVDKDGHALFLTAAGLGIIERRRTTLSEKAAFFEAEIDKRHRRTEFEYILEVNLKQPGDLSTWEQHDSDNDGLWTGMDGAAQ